MTTTPEPAPAPDFMQPAPRKKRRTGRIILIVVAALVGLLIVAGLGIYLLVGETTKDAQKVSDQFVVAIQQGDGAAAYALTAPSFRAATTEAQLTELVKNISPLVSKQKPSTNQKSINVSSGNGKIAVFVYTMPAASGDSKIYFKTQIREEDERWQVMNFRSSESALDTDVE